jgi:hypothetical protein
MRFLATSTTLVALVGFKAFSHATITDQWHPLQIAGVLSQEYTADIQLSWETDALVTKDNANSLAHTAQTFITRNIPERINETLVDIELGIVSVTFFGQSVDNTSSPSLLWVELRVQGLVEAKDTFDLESFNFTSLVYNAIHARDDAFLRLVRNRVFPPDATGTPTTTSSPTIYLSTVDAPSSSPIDARTLPPGMPTKAPTTALPTSSSATTESPRNRPTFAPNTPSPNSTPGIPTVTPVSSSIEKHNLAVAVAIPVCFAVVVLLLVAVRVGRNVRKEAPAVASPSGSTSSSSESIDDQSVYTIGLPPPLPSHNASFTSVASPVLPSLDEEWSFSVTSEFDNGKNSVSSEFDTVYNASPNHTAASTTP